MTGKSTPRIEQVATSEEIDAVRDLLREYTAWAFSLAPESSDAPTFQGMDQELEALPTVYAPPAGRLLLASLDGAPAGCVCLKPRDSETCELKRLYVRPAFRGTGIGRRLVAKLIAEARQAGYRRIVLDSHVSMTAAHAIYQEEGFRFVDTPADFPEHLKPVAIFMELDLYAG